MIKRKQRSRTVISLHDNEIKYLTLSKNDYGFYIKNYDSAKLEEDVIKNGEVLRVEFLGKILSKISKEIGAKSVDVILPHEYFLFDRYSLKKEKRQSHKKTIKQYLKKHKEYIPWARTHAYEYDFFERGDELKVLVRAIPIEIHSAYQEVFKKSGMKIDSIQSEIVSFSNLLFDTSNCNQIFVDHNATYVLEYYDGIFTSGKRFDVSYKNLIQDIKRNINVSNDEAKKILLKYGVLGTHRDKKVFKSLKREMDYLIRFLKQDALSKKNKNKNYVHFSEYPIPGFSDVLRRVLDTEVYDLCVFCNSKNTFQDVLTLHKSKSYAYEPLIARALRFWKN